MSPTVAADHGFRTIPGRNIEQFEPDMTAQIVPVLLAGGAGTRLWPVSRDALPKQFLPLVGDRSTYQETLLRVQVPMFAPPIVITGPDFHFFARRQAEEVGVEAMVVIEPARRDSGPAIAAATAVAARRDPKAFVLALAADHIILDIDAFRATCSIGLAAADAGSIVTFGIKPSEPKTSYGYILPGPAIAGEVRKVERFVEKPDASTAARYVRDGYLWNSGNFLFRADVLLGEVARLEPEMAAAVEAAVANATEDLGFLRLDPASFARSPAEVDRLRGDGAHRSRRRRDRQLPLVGYRQLGRAVRHPAARRGWQRAARARGDASIRRTASCIPTSGSPLIGVKDTVVVTTPDAVLVVPRARAQEVREMVTKLKAAKRAEATDHRRVHRPWGYYESIDCRRPLSGQAHRRHAWRHPVAAEAPPPRRALGGRARHRGSHHRREDAQRARERIDLHPDRQRAPARQPGPHPAGIDRGADRQLFRRR